MRELQNVLERAVITRRGGWGEGGARRRLRLDLPAAGSVSRDQAASVHPTSLDEEVVPEAELRRRERDNLLAALRRSDWRISGPGGAAELLGVRPTTLSSRIKKLRLERPRGRVGLS